MAAPQPRQEAEGERMTAEEAGTRSWVEEVAVACAPEPGVEEVAVADQGSALSTRLA